MKQMVALATAAALLGACSNQVFSERPLFAPTREPALRPGVWAAPSEPCRFDPAAALKAWPKCAGGQVVQPGQRAWRERRISLQMVGDPPILQVSQSDRRGPYYYHALEPLRRDAQGHIVEMETWPVLCGPPPTPRPNEQGEWEATDGVTDHLLPGLIVSGQNCEARDPAAVRNAAAASRGWEADMHVRSFWVRDGEN